MKTLSKILIFLSFFCLIPFNIQAKELTVNVVKECDIQYAGDNCVIDLNLINNTNETLDGKMAFSILHNGEELQDQTGIDTFFNISFSDFDISKGITLIHSEIKTHPALMSGIYSFTFSIEGMGEEKIYSTPSVSGGGGTTFIPTPKIIPTEFLDTEMTIEELKAKIKEIQIKLISLIQQLIINFLNQLISIYQH